MQDLVTVLSNEDGIQISLDVQQDAVLQIGEMMQEIQEEAYMNGENWAIFFQYYLEQYAPDLLEDWNQMQKPAYMQLIMKQQLRKIIRKLYSLPICSTHYCHIRNRFIRF